MYVCGCVWNKNTVLNFTEGWNVVKNLKQEESVNSEGKMKLQYRNLAACILAAEKKLSKPCREEATTRQSNWKIRSSYKTHPI